LLLAQSLGTWAIATLFSTGNNTAPNDVAHMPNDWQSDLIIANFTASTVGVLLSTSSVLAVESTLTSAAVSVYPSHRF
jgi:hypothetical protein